MMTLPGDKVRVRFAPSPTGSLHVGGARTALFNWLFAKSQGGTLVLRIEDTDYDRTQAASEAGILRDMRWLGLSWDEGPEAGGSHGPYRQSDRVPLYQEAAKRLEQAGVAYPCFCTPEELEAKRKAALAAHQTPRYDGACRRLSSEERSRRAAAGQPPALRFRMGDDTVVVEDLVKGPVTFHGDLIGGDFVIVKSDGSPSYNFACVVDDAAMEMTHVIRGDEHLNNTPRQMLLYRALGYSEPRFGHLSMILAPDHTKLSKRHGTTAVGEYQAEGFLPEALMNYLALLGWSPGDDQEIFLPEGWTGDPLDGVLAGLTRRFSLDRTLKNPAVFDKGKLIWLNAHYLRTGSLDRVAEWAKPFVAATAGPEAVENEAWLRQAVEMVRTEAHTLAEVGNLVAPWRSDEVVPDAEAAAVLQDPVSAKVLAALRSELEGLTAPLTFDEVKPLLARVQASAGVKGKALYQPLRAAITGSLHGPELVQLFPLLGRDRIVQRLSHL